MRFFIKPAMLWRLVALSVTLTANAQPVTLDFSASDNLKMVYDAGLRPWRVTTDDCEVDEVSLRVVLPQKQPFVLDVEFVNFSVLADYRFSTVDFKTHRLSMDDAIAKAQELATACGINTAGLTDFAAQEKRSPGSTKLGYWNAEVKYNGLAIDLTVESFPQYGGGVNANIQFGLNWDRGEFRKYFTKPMTPPPGYENMSMAKPPGDPNRKPLISVEEMRRLNDIQTKLIQESDMPPEGPTRRGLAVFC